MGFLKERKKEKEIIDRKTISHQYHCSIFGNEIQINSTSLTFISLMSHSWRFTQNSGARLADWIWAWVHVLKTDTGPRRDTQRWTRPFHIHHSQNGHPQRDGDNRWLVLGSSSADPLWTHQCSIKMQAGRRISLILEHTCVPLEEGSSGAWDSTHIIISSIIIKG